MSSLLVMPSTEDLTKHKETMGFLFLTFYHDAWRVPTEYSPSIMGNKVKMTQCISKNEMRTHEAGTFSGRTLKNFVDVFM